MKSDKIKRKIGITAIPAIFLVGHLIWPSQRIDNVALGLIALCFLPWLGVIFKSIELPGVAKVEYRDELNRETKRLESSGLIDSDIVAFGDPIYATLINADPNLALAGLRIDIERKLRKIASFENPNQENLSISRLVASIAPTDLFTLKQIEALNGILRGLNNAVHGGKISVSDAEEVMLMGLRLLGSLDKRIKKQESAQK